MIKFLLIFIISLNSFAKDKNNIFESLYLGEQDFSQYYGPNDPALLRKKYSERPIFSDQEIRNKYFENNLGPQMFSLIEFISIDLPRDSRCPNYQLEKNLEYIRYLFRLISISYLFENLKELWVDSYNLGYGDFCSLEWDKTFGQCRAINLDMANFLKRIKGKHLKGFSKLRLKRMKAKDRENWIKKFKAKDKKLSVTEARINLFCQENGINCKGIDADTLKFAFQLSCAQDQYTLINICSGYDHLYGLSNVANVYGLLTSSEAFKFIDQEGYGKECLKRYTRIFKEKEIPSEVLASIFPKVSKLMKKDKRVYSQGSLFVSGSFKGFDAKGLGGFLFPKDTGKTQEMADREKELTKNLAKIKKQEVVEEKPVYVLENPSSKDLNKLALEIRANSQGLNSKKKIEPQFKKMEMKRFLIGADKVALDMGQFRRDFILSTKIKESTMVKARAYAGLEVLKKLISAEELGSTSNPLSLVYLKFLIDSANDTGLENIVKLYKGQLYVLNDLIGPRKVSFIELKKLDLGWQIYILKQNKKSSKGPKFKTK